MLRLLLLLCLSAPVFASPAAERGQEIAQQADARLHGYGDMKVQLGMVLISPSGETAQRSLRVSSVEMGAEGDRTLMVFDTPQDVAGAGLLSWNHSSGDDEQWLYLPALQRTKQIGARNKSGPFMASEFAYEDIVTPFWQKFRYQFLREETLDKLPCWVVERTPNDANSGYTRQIVWIDRNQQLIRRIDYYDRKEALLKTYTASGFSEHAGHQWRPAQMLMVNHQTGRQTRLQWSAYRFGAGLKGEDFTQNALQRVR